GQRRVANPGQHVFVGQGVEEVNSAVVQGGGVPRVAVDFGLDAVQQSRCHPAGDRCFLLDQVFGDQRAGGAQTAANVHERDVLQVAAGLVVVDDSVDGGPLVEAVSAGIWLAVHHHEGFAVFPFDIVDGDQFQVQVLDHGLVLGPPN